MTEQLSTVQLMQFFDKRLILPMLPMFNRLEARPRTHHFDQALRAEVRDPLWMLTKQWQMGEFKGDDAGSPVSAKLLLEKTMLDKYRAARGESEAFDDSVPLEAKVEQRKIPFVAGDLEIALDLRLMMGRHWLKLLQKHGLSTLKSAYINAFQVHQVDPESRDDVYYSGSQISWRQHAAAVQRHIDGKKLYDDIVADNGSHVITVAAADSDHAQLITLGQRFVAWFDKLFYQPAGEDGNDAWLPSNLEYQFKCSAPKDETERVLAAKEYYHGHLDWYNFSIESGSDGLGEAPAADLPVDFNTPIKRSFLPTPVQFDGMPNTRWWAFEEGKTNFGDIRPDTTDINKLLLIEFGLVYANDWYLLPLTVPAGTLANVRGMSVKNVFGENFWITATGQGFDDQADRWTMYSMDIAGDDQVTADLSLLVVPSVPKIQQGKPIEEIQLTRDEAANMVWGIETRVPLPSGASVPGREAARDTLRHLRALIEDSAIEDEVAAAANIRYKVMSQVPENWIPFVSTHEEGSNRETRLQRASMPRILPGDPEQRIEKVKPRTHLLREGLNQAVKESYFINEEEILRAGVLVSQSFQRTRWYDGAVFNWLGVRKRTGRGESSSQLRFDYLQAMEKSQPE